MHVPMVSHCLGHVRLRLGVLGLVMLASGLTLPFSSGCGAVGILSDECGGTEPPPPDRPLSPIAMALRYLEFTQIKEDYRVGNTIDYAGNWPQCSAFAPDGPFVREISPFAPAFIHHALALVTADSQEVLGLTDADIEAARAMRTRAIQLMLRFEAAEGEADAGTFGYWPAERQGWRPGDLLLAALLEHRYGGPRFMGYRFPANVSFFPASFAIPTDADVTAVVYAALLDDAVLDGGPPVSVAFERFFSDWRDLGQVPQRNRQPWIRENSGAFLTWLAYRDDPDRPGLNDVDIVVNASVLYALGRYGRLDTPGVAESLALINDAIVSGVHLTHPNELSLYYSDAIILHYFVTRAYSEGGVTALAPAVEHLVDDLVATVQIDAAGMHFWDRGAPHMNTAYAALALMNAQQSPDLARSAVNYLVSQQDPSTGAWEPGPVFIGRLDDGTEVAWQSAACTTATALEALCRRRLASAGS